MTNTTIIEIVHAPTDAVIVCDTLDHCISCDDGLADKADAIRAALARGDEYMIGGGAAEGFIIRRAPAGALAAA